MPITFAPPEPLSPSISSGAGAAEQWSRDFPALVHQQDTLARIYEADAALRARGGAQAMQVAAGIQGQNAAMQARADEQASAQQHQLMLLGQQANAQAGLQAQHFDLQNQLMTNQLSQGEALRLQRLRSAMGTIQEQVSSGDLSPEEGRALAFQVQTGINPLQQRQARSQLQMQELQRQQLEQQVAFQDQLLQQRTRFMNGSLGDRLRTETDEFGQDHTVVLGLDGNIDWHATQLWQAQSGRTLEALQTDQQGGAGGGARRTRQAGGGGGQGGAIGGMDPALRRIAIQEATALAGRDEQGRQKAPSAADIDAAYQRLAGEQPEQPQQLPRSRQQVQAEVWGELQHAFRDMGLTPQQMRQLRDEETNRRMGVQQTRMQQLRDQAVQRQRFNQMGMLGRLWAGAQQQAPGQQQALGATAPATPFPTTEGGAIDRDRLAPAQLQALQQFDTARERARALPRGRQENLLPLIDQAERIRAQYGTISAMPPGVYRRYLNMIEVLERIPREAPAAPRTTPGGRRDEPAAGRAMDFLGDVGSFPLG